jgi:putative membrane-bound dehydrogenase-like protein
MRPTTIAILCWTLLVSSSIAAETEYSIGVAKEDITPNYPIRLHGFGGRRTESEGITQPIWAKALAIGSDDQQPAILFAVDNLGVRMAMVDEVARRLKEKAGIKRERIALTFTHSHTTPKTSGSADTIFSSPIPPEHQQRIDRYTAELTDALERVALAALADRKPAQLAWAVGKVGFAKNRRTENGPVDHDLPMLIVKDAGGSIRAIYVTYACHCVTLSDNKISGDWAGYAQEAIEKNHPGAVALVSIGCGSDSNPDSGVTGDNIAVAAEQGAQIAAEVDRLLRGELKPLAGQIAAELKTIDLPLGERPSRGELEKLSAEDSPAGYNAKFQLAKLERGEQLLSAIEYPIQTWVFGDDLAMVFLGGEICVDYSIRLKQLLNANRLWLHGYANDFCCYIPSERLVREGGYGGGAEVVYFALPATLQAGLEQKIVDEVLRQVPPGFHRSIDSRQTSTTQPTSANDALAAIQTHDDFVVEIMAAEPLIASPVAIDFGPNGELYVAEMMDYGRNVEDDFKPSGRVKVLADRDQDGHFDRATVLVDGLRFPTDVKAWRKGVIVCDAPDVIYLEDTDGDGIADVRKTLLTGFETHNAQARVNSLRWGLDNWLYGSCGLFGGRIRSSSGAELELGASDFRFRPESGQIELVTGRTQQGRARNDWGDWFGCENGSLCDHYPLANHYLARNPHAVPPATEVSVLGGDHPNRLFPAGQLVLFQLSGPPGRPTAACGLEIYRDNLLGSEFAGNAFVAEPVNQLVHRRVLERRGATFLGERAANERQREFLTSTDHWFRPVQIRTGPDGCLWIVDMCRYVIEHPRFLPPETLRSIDPLAGQSSGRIFRVRPRNTPPRPILKLDQLDTAGLVAALDSPNGPQRDLAQQILVERGDKSAVAEMALLLTKSEYPEVRLQVLCTLDGLNALSVDFLLSALSDGHAGVRRHAIRLSEQFVDEFPALRAAVIDFADDKDPQVQLQLAYTLGELRDESASKVLADLAWQHHEDPYLFAAVVSSVGSGNARAVLRSILTADKPSLPPNLRSLASMIATKLGDEACRDEALTLLSRSADGKMTTAQLTLLADILLSADAPRRSAEGKQVEPPPAVASVLAHARRVIEDGADDIQKTIAALRIVATTSPEEVDLSDALSNMLGPRHAPDVHEAAVNIAAQMPATIAGELLLENWSGYTPALRAQVMETFMSRDDLLPQLLDAISRGEVKASQIDALQRQRLIAHGDRAIRAAASAAFNGGINADRKKVLESYAQSARLPGNAGHGRELFQKVCASCHRLEDHGYAVGPDLAALTSRMPSALLEAVLDPNRAVDERYQTYLAVTEDGRTYTGILSNETAVSITLKEQQGKEHTLLRNSLETIVNGGDSLMPEGYEKDFSVSDLADLLAYMASCGAPAKTLSGNRPELVRPNAAGAVWLLASNCQVRGGDITFETPFQNIGMWHREADHLVWDVEVDGKRLYDVYLEWACDDGSAGSKLTIDGFDTPVQFAVTGTGGWNSYRTKRIGQAMLSPGRNRIVVRPDGEPSQALLDLRGIYLVASADSKSNEADSDPAAPADAATAVTQLVDGLAVGTKKEYDRIPRIWEHAIAAGKRNDSAELQRLLLVSLPEIDAPAQHWQVVVIGGGIVNGLTMQGSWPGRRIAELLRGNSSFEERWDRLVTLSAKMADDESVPAGTRYDALRILGTQPFEAVGTQLTKYLRSDSVDLQMGAVSGLGDVEDERATTALLAEFGRYARVNRELAFGALVRTEERCAALLNALESSSISQDLLDPAQIRRLLTHENDQLRTRAKTIIQKE